MLYMTRIHHLNCSVSDILSGLDRMSEKKDLCQLKNISVSLSNSCQCVQSGSIFLCLIEMPQASVRNPPDPGPSELHSYSYSVSKEIAV